jgi:AcrR family transcriptional regulator
MTASDMRPRRASVTRREKQERTRAALLRAAERAFCRHGLEAASIDQVAHDAGYTKGAFYAHFKSKEELFLVMLDERFARELERLDSMLAGGAEPLEEARAAAADFIHFASDEHWPWLYFQFIAHAARDEQFRAQLAIRMRAMRARLADLLARWVGSFGRPPPLPQRDIAAMVLFMADGFLVQRIIEPNLSEELYTTMMEVFMRGLEAIAVEADRAPAPPTGPSSPFA